MWLGFDIGGTKLAVVVGDAAGRIAARRRRAISASGDPRTDVNAMLRDAHELLAEAGVAPSALRGVGVAAPGPIDFARGVVESPPNLAGWGSVPIRDVARRRVRRARPPRERCECRGAGRVALRRRARRAAPRLSHDVHRGRRRARARRSALSRHRRRGRGRATCRSSGAARASCAAAGGAAASRPTWAAGAGPSGSRGSRRRRAASPRSRARPRTRVPST